jgi:hypothetical protein
MSSFFLLPLFHFHFVDGEFAIGEQGLIDLLIVQQLLISSQELKYLLNNFSNLVFYLIKHPVVITTEGEDAGIFEVDEVAGSFGLREIEDLFEV